jgi:hypothetical protein
VTTDGQSASLSWNKAHIWGLRPDFYYCQTFAGLLMWEALSDERTGLSFTIDAGPRQQSHSRVRVPWDSRPYFTASDSTIQECTAFYNFYVARIEVTASKGSTYSSLMFCLGNNVLIPKQRFGFLSVYNFRCPYPWKPCFLISWFPWINLSVATGLPIRFPETAHMSQYFY